MCKQTCGVLALVLATAVYAATDTFEDPLDLPVVMIKRQLTTTQMSAVTHAGNRLVAVGMRATTDMPIGHSDKGENSGIGAMNTIALR